MDINMSADEARSAAWNFNTAEDKSQYALVKKSIITTAMRGEYACTVYESIRKDVRKKLTEEGFIVGGLNSDRDGYYVSISWERPE